VAAKIAKARTAEPKKAKPGQVFGSKGVHYSFPKGEGGPIEIRIDFGSLAPPTNYCYADSLHLAIDEDLRMAVLSFGLRNKATNKFADRIDVAMPRKPLCDQFWNSTRDVEKTLDGFLEATGPAPKLRPISPPEPQPQVTTFFANAIFVALGEGEATLDFYHMPPRAVHLAKTQKADIELLPVVRVIVSSVLTKHFFETLRPHAEGADISQAALDRSDRAARSH
jgi:hypothetical protein